MHPNGASLALIVSGFIQISSPVVINIFIYSFDLERICNLLFLLREKFFFDKLRGSG